MTSRDVSRTAKLPQRMKAQNCSGRKARDNLQSRDLCSAQLNLVIKRRLSRCFATERNRRSQCSPRAGFHRPDHSLHDSRHRRGAGPDSDAPAGPHHAVEKLCPMRSVTHRWFGPIAQRRMGHHPPRIPKNFEPAARCVQQEGPACWNERNQAQVSQPGRLVVKRDLDLRLRT